MHVAHRNIELKARLTNLDDARAVARKLTDSGPSLEHQRDVYFAARRGRLKLRRIDDCVALLISYSRPDQTGYRTSDYTLVEVPNPTEMEQALEAALGLVAVVDKRREIYLYRNVRIHLDEVEGLGEFLEFEAVIGPDDDEQSSRKLLDELSDLFKIAPSDSISVSYVDLLDVPAGR